MYHKVNSLITTVWCFALNDNWWHHAFVIKITQYRHFHLVTIFLDLMSVLWVSNSDKSAFSIFFFRSICPTWCILILLKFLVDNRTFYFTFFLYRFLQLKTSRHSYQYLATLLCNLQLHNTVGNLGICFSFNKKQNTI